MFMLTILCYYTDRPQCIHPLTLYIFNSVSFIFICKALLPIGIVTKRLYISIKNPLILHLFINTVCISLMSKPVVIMVSESKRKETDLTRFKSEIFSVTGEIRETRDMCVTLSKEKKKRGKK